MYQHACIHARLLSNLRQISWGYRLRIRTCSNKKAGKKITFGYANLNSLSTLKITSIGLNMRDRFNYESSGPFELFPIYHIVSGL